MISRKNKQTNDGKGFKLGSRRYKTIDGFMHALKNEVKDETVSVDPDDFQDGIEIECAPECVALDGSCDRAQANKEETFRVDEEDFAEAVIEANRRTLRKARGSR